MTTNLKQVKHTDFVRKSNREALLRVNNIKKWFPYNDGIIVKNKKHIKAVDGISFTLHKGETLGIVGESGSGKSTLGRSLIRLIDPTSGEVFFKDTDILSLKGEKLRDMRKQVQMVFQDPYATLNPRMRIGNILAEPLKIHGLVKTKSKRIERVDELLELVGVNPDFKDRYPHELSGGQRQRISIARALAVSPELIVFDEAVSALDVSIQAQVLNLIRRLQKELDLTYIFISHDLSVVKHISSHIGVMYLGKIVEYGNKKDIFERPNHPYTKSLLSAVPTTGKQSKRERIILKGEIPSPADIPNGCRFRTRCYMAQEICSREEPVLVEMSSSHQSACLFAKKEF